MTNRDAQSTEGLLGDPGECTIGESKCFDDYTIYKSTDLIRFKILN